MQAGQKPVLGVVTTWFERGATRVSLAYIEVLRNDFDIRVYARSGDAFPHNDPAWNQDFVYWSEFVPGAPKTHIDWRDFEAWMKREAIDVLLFNEQQDWDVIVRLQRLQERPLMGAYIDYYTDESVGFFHLYDFLLCNTRRHLSAFETHPQALYVPWGVDVASFPIEAPPERPFTYFHSLGYNPYRKGTDLTIQAFSGLKHDNIRLVLHAQRPLSDFPDLAPLVHADQRISWIHQEVPPPGLYHLGDVYVYPSRLDGIGLSLPEALASGLPAITTDEPPMNEFVTHGENGFLVPVAKRWKRDDQYFWEMGACAVDDIAKAMDAAWNARNEWDTWRKRTRAMAEQQLDWKQNARDLPEQLKRVSRLQPTAELVDECADWQRAKTPALPLRFKVHRLLVKLGARKVKRAVFGRS
jgi:glycosyltransferase involved in cell wall biosynthesis